MKTAVLGFSYGYRKDDPGISNRALIKKFYERCSEEHIPLGIDLILQSELADAHNKEGLGEYDRFCGLKIVHVIDRHRVAGEYLDTDEVARQGIDFAATQRYKEILVLAYPYIHRPYCLRVTLRFAEPYGITVGVVKTGWIPADPSSEQWWTRNLIAPILYIAKSKLFGTRGK